MPFLPGTFAEDVINQPARAQFEAFLDEHRGELNRCLDGLTEEQARRPCYRVVAGAQWLRLLTGALAHVDLWLGQAVCGAASLLPGHGRCYGRSCTMRS